MFLVGEKSRSGPAGLSKNSTQHKFPAVGRSSEDQRAVHPLENSQTRSNDPHVSLDEKGLSSSVCGSHTSVSADRCLTASGPTRTRFAFSPEMNPTWRQSRPRGSTRSCWRREESKAYQRCWTKSHPTIYPDPDADHSCLGSPPPIPDYSLQDAESGI